MTARPATTRLTLLPSHGQAGKRPAVRRYKLGRVVGDVDLGPYLRAQPNAAPASGVRAP